MTYSEVIVEGPSPEATWLVERTRPWRYVITRSPRTMKICLDIYKGDTWYIDAYNYTASNEVALGWGYHWFHIFCQAKARLPREGVIMEDDCG